MTVEDFIAAIKLGGMILRPCAICNQIIVMPKKHIGWAEAGRCIFCRPISPHEDIY